MSEDRLLNDLGELARQQEEAERLRLDERWDRLAAGTLTPEEDAELRALAAASPEAREIYEAFRPLGPDFQARVVDAVRAAQAAERTVPPAPSPEPLTEPLQFRPPPPQPSPRPARRLAAWLGTAAAAAAAAAVLFVFLLPPAAPLPLYTAELSGGVQISRGTDSGPAGPPLFLPGARLTLTIRPEHAVEGPVAAQVFAQRGGAGDLTPVEPAPRFEQAGGSLLLRGTVGEEIRLPAGTRRLWIVVGRPGKIPPPSEVAAALRAGQTAQGGWQAVSADLRIEDRAPS